jgi:TonB family protein
MHEDVEALSDREREALRLLARGHEAKSIASALGISVHTVNERLRAARRKLGVSSSREAARLLLAHEAGSEGPDNVGYKRIGVARGPADQAYSPPARSGAIGARRRLTWVMIGAIMLVAILSVLMIANAGNDPAAPRETQRAVEPIGTIPSLFAASDYPAAAAVERAQGTTAFRLQVGKNGRVEKCDVERSSGSAALDEATCRVITRRSRFRPAIDGAGDAVASSYAGEIHWRL